MMTVGHWFTDVCPKYVLYWHKQTLHKRSSLLCVYSRIIKTICHRCQGKMSRITRTNTFTQSRTHTCHRNHRNHQSPIREKRFRCSPKCSRVRHPAGFITHTRRLCVGDTAKVSCLDMILFNILFLWSAFVSRNVLTVDIYHNRIISYRYDRIESKSSNTNTDRNKHQFV